MAELLPLSGVTVVDVTRMLPGAVLVRSLVDLGARVVKVEDPAGGDPMRSLPPLVGGTGAGFCAFFRGVESLALDLRTEAGLTALAKLARHADVLLESFRPGTLDRWGLPLPSLRERCPALVTCSLSGFGPREPWASLPGHDLNFVAASGLLLELRAAGVPRVQLADVTAGHLALSGILAALLLRARTGRGSHVEQPLATGPLPFLTWTLADRSAGGGGVTEGLLSGRAPSYGVYACADGREVAVGALEPKFWIELVTSLGLPGLAGDGLDTGERGEEAARRLAEAFRSRPSADWLALAADRGIPLTPVREAGEVSSDPYLRSTGALTEEAAPGGGRLTVPGPAVGGARRELPPAPALGEGNARILRELGLDRAGARRSGPA